MPLLSHVIEAPPQALPITVFFGSEDATQLKPISFLIPILAHGSGALSSFARAKASTAMMTVYQ